MEKYVLRKVRQTLEVYSFFVRMVVILVEEITFKKIELSDINIFNTVDRSSILYDYPCLYTQWR